MSSVREASFDLFREHGMTTIFGNPGSTELPMLAEFPDDFTYVLGLQEAVAVGMADGYAQASGQVGHVNLHTAPGVGNGMGAIFNAQANKSSLLVTAGQQVRAQVTMNANLTNRDATRVPHPLVKWSFEPPRAQDVPLALGHGIQIASLPPRGPAFVSLPMDDWTADVDDAEAQAAIKRSLTTRSGPDPEAIKELAARIEKAENPVLVAGPDIDASGGWDDAIALAERQKLPVFASPAPGGGRLGFPEGHPLFQGVLPPAIGPVAETLKGKDLILVVGSSVFPYYPYIPGPLLPEGASLVAITSDPDEAARAPMGDAIVADVGLALKALLAAIQEGNRAEPTSLPDPQPGEESDPLTPTMVHNTLAGVFPEDGIIVLESPSSTLALRNQLRISKPGSYYFGAGGGLGFGLAAAIGVQMAQPDRPVVCVLGEGSAQYAVTGFWTAAAYEVPVTFLVLRNEEYAILKWFAGIEEVQGAPGLDLPTLDTAAVAEAYGVPAKTVSGREELDEALKGAIGSDGPQLVEVPVTPGMALFYSVELLAPDVERIAPEGGEPAADRAPDELAEGTPEPLRGDLEGLLGADRLLTRAIDLVSYASDASPYRVLPQAVVMAREADDVATVLAYGRRTGTPVTLRAGGTSLNGQGQGAGIMVDVRRHWRGVAVEDGGARARVKPGTLLGHANRVLAPHGRKLGPDPASTEIACVGGVVANNSGGMRCGVARDSYRTVAGLTFVLPSGTTIDTTAPGAEEEFARAEPELAKGLREIRDEIRADAELSERIQRKFEIKNTTGYRLCAFLDAETPLEIFRRLLVGSEGTLAFTAEVLFDTVPQPPRTTVSWLHFNGIESATDPVPELVAAGASAVELMVAPALMVAAQNIKGAPQDWMELPPESAALLVEFGAETDEELNGLVAGAEEILGHRELIRPPDFTREQERIEIAWTVREGLHGLIGRLRPPGTALIIEDVCVPPERIAESARDIQALLGEHGFLTGVAGHTSAGNLHFMLTPDFSKPEDLERYEAFMGKLVELIVDKYDGSLKAEHGTGINMAPYVEREWGVKATEMMWRIKSLADPDGVLAPGVLLNRDPGVHLQNLKTTPPIEEEATNCVECGFCEPVCPSRDLTMTPRQRIVVRREMARQPHGSAVQTALLREYEYDGIETCAADGSCALTCPLGIDTGKLVKGFRAAQHDEKAERRGKRLAERWARVERLARAGLRAGGPLRGAPARTLTRALRAGLSNELVPDFPAPMPRAAAASDPETSREGAVAVYLPACVNRIFGRPRGAGEGLGVREALVAVSARAGQPVWIPEDAPGHCCAVPWSSKGLREGHELMANRTVEALWRWSGEGELPVVIDASSCALGLGAEVVEALGDQNRERHAKLEILDSVAWAHDRLLPKLQVGARLGSVALHPTCSTRHLGHTRKLEAVASAISAEPPTVPLSATCCGMAGDRGLLHPELTRSATAGQAAELEDSSHDAYLSSNRTCEIGLQQGTGEPYESFLVALELATR